MIERGEKAPSIEKLIIIYEELGIDITYLLTGQEERNNISNYIERCPKEKRYDFEQLIKYALNLVNVK